MSRALVTVGVVAVAALAAAVVFGGPYATKTSTRTVLVAPCGDRTFGHVRSLTRSTVGG